MADSSSVDAALAALLSADPVIQGLLPDGGYFDLAAKDSRRYLLLSLLDHDDSYVFEGTGWETFLYLVKAVTLDSSPKAAMDAAARVHALLQDKELVVPGYWPMKTQRIEHIRILDTDEPTAVRWQQVGGHYELWLQPLTTP